MREVRVTWRDAVTAAGWEHRDEAAKTRPHNVVTVGHLLREDEESITVALSVDPDASDGEGVSGYVVIPKSWVLKKENLMRPGEAKEPSPEMQWPDGLPP